MSVSGLGRHRDPQDRSVAWSARLALCLLLLAPTGAVVAGRADYNRPNYNESKVAPYALENPLVFSDGRKVDSAAAWAKRRREILDIFAREMYGVEPPKPQALVIEKFDDAVTLAGFGIRRQYRMWFKADKSGPAIDWLVLLPRHAKGPVPTILFLNYGGNHELIRDQEVRLPEGAWIRFAKTQKADPAMRGRYENMNSGEFVFPAHMILARGYALVSACYAQVSPDTDPHLKVRQPPTYSGVFDLWPPRDETRTDNTTALGAWAWALSRGLDLVEKIPECDAKRAVATGYSRLGKTALLAAARDERFAVCVPNQTGGGGCPLAKRDFGENIATQMKSFPHWYCRAYAKYETDPAKLLTFDQHLLLATLAPRGLFVQGYDNPWFDTKGEYLACRAASPAWTFLGFPGLPNVAFPGDYDTSCIGRCLGYVRRTEGHGHAAHDWTWLLDFTDRYFASARSPRGQAPLRRTPVKGAKPFNPIATLTAKLDAATESYCRAAAARVPVKGHVNILFLGDSLTDFDRDRNHASIMADALEKAHPGAFTVYNYAIGGDYCEQTWNRMNGRKSYRLEAFDDIWSRPYDWAFIFLGANDSKTPTVSGHKIPLTTAEAQKRLMGEMIAFLKGKGVKRIILISPAVANFPVCQRITAKRERSGRNCNLFGEPKQLEAFAAVDRHLAETTDGVEFLDIYTPMKARADAYKMTRPTDGVHLVDSGYRFVACRLLEYLAGGEPRK